MTAQLIADLAARGHTVAVAESLTGGLVTATLTEVPGASSVLLGGVVTYATAAKVSLLSVSQSLIDEHGVVSAECALAMATGMRERLGAHWGLATTGVAGPGPQDGLAAGTVHVAVVGAAGGRSGRESVRESRALHLDGSRSEVRAATVHAALGLLSEALGTVGGPRDGRNDER